MGFSNIDVTFVTMLSMNKFTSTFIPTYFQIMQLLIIDTNFDILMHVNIVMHDWNLDEKHLVCDNNCNILNL
jgi:hypothetical protein